MDDLLELVVQMGYNYYCDNSDDYDGDIDNIDYVKLHDMNTYERINYIKNLQIYGIDGIDGIDDNLYFINNIYIDDLPSNKNIYILFIILIGVIKDEISICNVVDLFINNIIKYVETYQKEKIDDYTYKIIINDLSEINMESEINMGSENNIEILMNYLNEGHDPYDYYVNETKFIVSYINSLMYLFVFKFRD